MPEKKKQDNRIFAGFYKRFNGKVIYVISTAKDIDSGEETIIFVNYDYTYPLEYYTCSKASFCEMVQFINETVPKYRRQPKIHLKDSFIAILNEDGFRGPRRKRKRVRDEEERFYQSSENYLEYAMDLCRNYKRDLRIYRLCIKHKRLVGIVKEDFPLLQEDIHFLHSMLDTDLKDYKEFFIDHFRKGISIRQYAANKSINRGSVEYQQKKLYAKLAELLKERDLSDGKKRIVKQEKNR